MRGLKSARNSTHSTPTASQGRFPALKRSVRPRGSAWAAPSKRQQTITQMDPFHAIYHPEENEEDLEYIDDAKEPYKEPPRQSKRRKISTDGLSVQSVFTRSRIPNTSRLAGNSKKQVQAGKEIAEHNQVEQCEDFQSSKMMPPPKTPISTRRKEIPSSQSPADTPSSVKHLRIIRDHSRSPLKERTTNNVRRPESPRKGIIKSGSVKEIADSVGTDEGRIASAFKAQNSPQRTHMTVENSDEELSPLQSPLAVHFDIDVIGFGVTKRENSSYTSENERYPRPPMASGNVRIKNEIVGSSVEKEQKDSEEDGKDIVKIKGNRETRRSDPIVQTSPSFDTALEPQPAAPLFPEKTFKDSLLRASSRIPMVPRPDADIDVPSSQPDFDCVSPTKTAQQMSFAHDKSTQDLASDQLHHELARYTQVQGALITESQYEKGWKSYHQYSIINPGPSSSALQPLSSPDKNIDPLSSTVPTQPFPNLNTVARAPVPPSQATTVDATQPSPRPPASQMSSPDLPPSSPPPPPVPLALSSSSPLLSRTEMGQGTRIGYEWDGRILTDSQLLPASLMEDSLVGPPNGWRVEDSEGDDGA